MFRIAVITYWFAAEVFLLTAATVQTRGGQFFSGNLEKIGADGVRIAGKALNWEDVARVRLNPSPVRHAGLSDVLTRIWRGNHKIFPDETALDPSLVDSVRRHYLTVRRLGNTPGAILFEGKLNVPRAGTYHFRLGSDDGAHVFVGGKEILATSAEYSFRRATGSIRLESGAHDFRLEYLNLASYAILRLEWNGPGLDWTHLSAVNDWPLPPAPPAVPFAGALAWNGSFIAHPVNSLDESKVNFVGSPLGIRLSTVNASAIFFQPLSLAFADRIRSGEVGREGVLLTTGDFLEGEISSIKNNTITLQTLLFGVKEYKGSSQVAAVFLQKMANTRERWRVRTRTGLEICLRKLKWEGNELVVNLAPFQGMRLKTNDINEISFLSEPNVLRRSWNAWKGMDKQERQRAVAGQNRFNAIHRTRSEARIYMAQLDEKWRRLESEHAAIEEEVKMILAGMQQREVAARKARSDWAETHSNYALANSRVNINAHHFNPKIREAREVKMRRLTDAKASLEAEKKLLVDTEKTNSERVAKYQADRARQQKQHEKHAMDRNADFNKARVIFKGDYRPVEITVAVAQARKAREFAENRRNRSRDYFKQYTPARDDARRRRDETKRRVDAAMAQRDARARAFQHAEAQEANILRTSLNPAEKKVFDLRADHTAKSAIYHGLIGKEAAIDQTRLDALSDLQSVDRHVRDWEAQQKTEQAKLKQYEQNKNNADRDHAKRLELFEVARNALYQYVDQQEKPALKRLTDVKARHDKLAQEVKENPGKETLVAQLTKEQAKVASGLMALTAVREKLNGLLANFQKTHGVYVANYSAVKKSKEEWQQGQIDLKLIEGFLASKRTEQAALRKLSGDLTRERTSRLNETRKVKGEMDRALVVLNQALGEHGRRIGEYGTAINRRYEAARNLEDGENTLKREQHSLVREEALMVLREKEWKRRDQVFKAVEAAFVAADRAFKQAEAAKAGFKKPLDGDQSKLMGPLEGWLLAQETVTHLRLEIVIEVDKMNGELEAERLCWVPSIKARDDALKRVEKDDKTAAEKLTNIEKQKEALAQALKDAEAADKAQQIRQAEAIKALADASNSLRDVRFRVGSKQRECLEAAFQHGRYRVQKRGVLGFE